MRRIIRARVASDLIDACFKNEGWTKREGQNRTKMVHEFYRVTREGDVYVARRMVPIVCRFG